MRKRYTVVLSEPERARLHTLIGQGAGPARALTHARKRWMLRLLADRLVQLEVVDAVSYETVRQALKQTVSSRG